MYFGRVLTTDFNCVYPDATRIDKGRHMKRPDSSPSGSVITSADDKNFRQLTSRLSPRGLSRIEAATYIGVSASLFDQMVKDGRMPGPKIINSRTVWDRHQLDMYFQNLPEKDEATLILNKSSEWDAMT
jgi:predicted DNA-binding transcriptional regulator AlpA